MEGAIRSTWWSAHAGSSDESFLFAKTKKIFLACRAVEFSTGYLRKAATMRR
jgi:hypothetical protein